MEIRELLRDELSPGELRALTDLVNLVDPERAPSDPPMPEEMVYGLLSPGSRFSMQRAWALLDGHAVAGIAVAEGPVDAENTDLFEMTVAVHPERRRQGLGGVLLDHLRSEARTMERPKLWAWGPLDDDDRGFWQDRAGLTLGYDERISRCVLGEVDADLMQRWVDQASERAADYHLERWQGSCPDDLVARYAVVREAMDDAPLDDLDHERDRFDVERIRDMESHFEDLRFDQYAIMAVHTGSGDPAGYTSVLIPSSRPQVSYQGDTVTLEAHRNRGIGRWMKAEMWQWLRRDRPDVSILNTGNAESNDAMLAINVAMGFTGHVNIGIWHQAGGD